MKFNIHLSQMFFLNYGNFLFFLSKLPPVNKNGLLFILISLNTLITGLFMLKNLIEIFQSTVKLSLRELPQITSL